MNEELEKEKQEIRNLASQLQDKLLSSQWYKQYYEKAMSKESNSDWNSERENDDIIFDFEDMEIETFPFFEQNQSNIILKYGYLLDEEREARQRRLAKQEADKIENNKVIEKQSNIFDNMRIMGEETRIKNIENVVWDHEKGKFVEKERK